MPQPLDPYDFGFMNNSNTIRPTLMIGKSVHEHLSKDNCCKSKRLFMQNKTESKCDITCSCRGQEFCSSSKSDEKEVNNTSTLFNEISLLAIDNET